MDEADWLSVWDVEPGPLITLSALAAHRLKVVLVEAGPEELPRWAAANEPFPTPPRSPEVALWKCTPARSTLPTRDPSSFRLEDCDHREARASRSDASLQVEDLPLPSLLLGQSLTPWPGPRGIRTRGGLSGVCRPPASPQRVLPRLRSLGDGRGARGPGAALPDGAPDASAVVAVLDAEGVRGVDPRGSSRPADATGPAFPEERGHAVAARGTMTFGFPAGTLCGTMKRHEPETSVRHRPDRNSWAVPAWFDMLATRVSANESTSTRKSKCAIESVSPGRSRPHVTRWPLIQSPLVLPRSRTTTSASTLLTQQWCRETRVEPSRTSHPGWRPITSGVRPTSISQYPSRATSRIFWLICRVHGQTWFRLLDTGAGEDALHPIDRDPEDSGRHAPSHVRPPLPEHGQPVRHPRHAPGPRSRNLDRRRRLGVLRSLFETALAHIDLRLLRRMWTRPRETKNERALSDKSRFGDGLWEAISGPGVGSRRLEWDTESEPSCVERQLGDVLARRSQARRRRSDPAALGPLLRAAGPAGRFAAARAQPPGVRRGGRRAECLPELLRGDRAAASSPSWPTATTSGGCWPRSRPAR